MILEQKQTTDIKTSEKFKELEFGIRSSDMGLVLEILRSKLYRNPIAAICREVASNARDANREAENNVPIEISIDDGLFSAGDLTISFKDVGPGISPERMADVFVNYGASTKRNDNIQTGGFGIGAKTPFSYTDNFTIVTIVDKVKYTYMAAIEEGNRGKIYLVTDEETPEQNGTSIIVPIKPQDRSYFEREVYRATMFWDMKPVYKNFRISSSP
jgi:DNA topoisomerase VI subunit B